MFLVRSLLRLVRKGWLAWSRFWLGQKDLRPLQAVRVGVALCVFIQYLGLLPRFGELYGPSGWIPRGAAAEWATAPGERAMLSFFESEALTWATYGILLLSAAAVALNRMVFVSKWLLCLSHLALLHCNPVIQYGADRLAANILWILALAPANLGGGSRVPNRASTRWASACLRLIQILLCVMYFVSGLQKAHGDAWWDGHALWISLTNHEFNRTPLHFFASHYWLANLLTFAMPLLEIAYPFLIANRKTRLTMMAVIMTVHLGILASMGMIYFSCLAIAANLAWLGGYEVTAIARWVPRSRLQ